MERCTFKKRHPRYGYEWECPLEALQGEDYCYWHKIEDKKEPTDNQLQELKENEINYAYLKKANLNKADLKKAYLSDSVLQEAQLFGANLQEADLDGCNLRRAELSHANLQEASITFAELEKADLISADLQKTSLVVSRLQEANLYGANLQEADLNGVNLSNANLSHSILKEASLEIAELSGARLNQSDLSGANLKKAQFHTANLSLANLQKTNLSGAFLIGANFYRTKFDSETSLSGSNLIGCNLFQSYIDETKSLRDVVGLFSEKSNKEINELVGDIIDESLYLIYKNNKMYPYKAYLRILLIYIAKAISKKFGIFFPLKPHILDLEAIKNKDPHIAETLQKEKLIRYVKKDIFSEDGNRIVFFDMLSECVLEYPEKKWWGANKHVKKIDGLADLVHKNNIIKSEFLFKSNRLSLYNTSYEIYNNLYNFYRSNGRLDQAIKIHYRKEEVHRKILKEKNLNAKLKSWTFNFFILKLLTGYGNRLKNPFIASIITILGFATIFRHINGIVKIVNDESVTPDMWDYLYHSIITFTSLGYSNIQPNLAEGHLPQLLVAIESGCGVLMIALVIFVITYQVSR